MRHLALLNPRPFSNAHWLLPVALVLVWESAFWSQACKEPPYYWEVLLACSTVCIALWTNHLRLAPLDGWRRMGAVAIGAIYDLASLTLFILLCGLPLAILMPEYQCYTPRAKVSELILASSSLRTEIGKRVLQNQSMSGVGLGLSVDLGGRVQWSVVTNDGQIVIASGDPPAVVAFTPSIADGKVVWKCVVVPNSVAPSMCRE